MSCGPGGERQRPYWCQVEGHVVSKSYCYPARPPVHREACHPGECPQWHSSQWGQVSPSNHETKHPPTAQQLNFTFEPARLYFPLCHLFLFVLQSTSCPERPTIFFPFSTFCKSSLGKSWSMLCFLCYETGGSLSTRSVKRGKNVYFFLCLNLFFSSCPSNPSSFSGRSISSLRRLPISLPPYACFIVFRRTC